MPSLTPNRDAVEKLICTMDASLAAAADKALVGLCNDVAKPMLRYISDAIDRGEDGAGAAEDCAHAVACLICSMAHTAGGGSREGAAIYAASFANGISMGVARMLFEKPAVLNAVAREDMHEAGRA